MLGASQLRLANYISRLAIGLFRRNGPITTLALPRRPGPFSNYHAHLFYLTVHVKVCYRAVQALAQRIDPLYHRFLSRSNSTENFYPANCPTINNLFNLFFSAKEIDYESSEIVGSPAYLYLFRA